jgi:iron complex outermembrane recepter protein
MKRTLATWMKALSMTTAALAMPGWTQPAVEAEIVVTAPRMSGPLEVVTDPSLPRQPLPAHDGADYLKTIPGFSVIRKGGTDGDPVFRGMAGSRLLVHSSEGLLLGGCGARMDPPTAYVFPQSYDRIRVLKGPQTVLWGAGVSAATVIFERDPFDPATDGASLGGSVVAGSWGRRDLAVDAQAGGELGYLRLQGSDSRADDYRDGDGERVQSAYRRWNTHAAVGWTPMADTLIEISASRSDGEAAYADRGMDGIEFDRRALALRARRDGVSKHVQHIELQLAHGYVDHVMDNFTLRDFTPMPMMPAPMVSNPDRESRAARLTAALDLGAAVNATVGLDAHDDRHRVRSAMGAAAADYAALPRWEDARFRQHGAFAEVEHDLAPGRRLIGGARLDRWIVEDRRELVRQGMGLVPNDTAGATDRDWLGSGFLRYEHGLARAAGSSDPEVTLFVGLGHAARSADYWERFGNDKRGPAGNSAFFTDPERTTQLDFGWIRSSADDRLSASLFANRVRDFVLIDMRAPDAPAGAVVTRSVDARSYGGELEYGRRLGDRWSADVAMAYTRGTNTTDDVPLAQIPPFEARLAVNYASGRFAAGGLLRWVAEQERVDPGRGNIAGQDITASDSFAVLSLNGSYRFSSALSLSAGVDNLLDATYAEHLSRSGAMVAGYAQLLQVPEPGRTAWLKLDVTL